MLGLKTEVGDHGRMPLSLEMSESPAGAPFWGIRSNSARGRVSDQMTPQDSFPSNDSRRTFLIVLTVLKCFFLMGNLSAGFNLTVAFVFCTCTCPGAMVTF